MTLVIEGLHLLGNKSKRELGYSLKYKILFFISLFYFIMFCLILISIIIKGALNTRYYKFERVLQMKD